ncbi:MAG: hypothetical protein IV100_02585 [Myxococcales bacterium]|nr:hypothetical protein [Myxococcales bacterium]
MMFNLTTLLVPALMSGSLFDPSERPSLHAAMEAHTRFYYGVQALPFGIGLTATAKDAAAVDALRAYAAGGELAGHPFDYLSAYEGASGIGLRGGGATPSSAFRYMALKQEGASDAALAPAREAVIAALEATHVAVAITGVPGRLARGIARLKMPDGRPVPGATPVYVPLKDDSGAPLPEPKNNGADRADNSGGALPEGMWYWQDSCSKDQIVGWAMAMATLYDAAMGDPTIDQSLVTRLQADAKAVGAMLREKVPLLALDGQTYEYDLVILDADGRPTQHHDLNPHGLDGLWLAPGTTVYNVFNTIMALGIVKALYHVSGDPELGAFLYDELIGKRCYHAMLSPSTAPCPGGWPGGVTPDESALDYIYGAELTNFSNVNMAAIALFLNLWFEEDAARVEPIRKYMETRWWAPDGVPQAASRIGQPYFEAIHALTTADSVTTGRMDDVAALLEEFELLPYTSAMRVNCDEAELAAGSCLALDGTTTLTLNPKLNRSDSPIALEPLRPGIRSPSNFDARSDPFEVNGGDESGLGLNPGGDLNAAYWMLRWAPERAAGTILTSPNARPWPPEPDPVPVDEAPVSDVESPEADARATDEGDVVTGDTSGSDLGSGVSDLGAPTAASGDDGGCSTGRSGTGAGPFGLLVAFFALVWMRTGGRRGGVARSS